MTLRFPLPLLSALALLAPALCGQTPTFLYSPAGAELMPGGIGTQMPFSATSATYQQIHDYDDMRRISGAKPVQMKGIAFRPSYTNTLPGRSWDLQINVGNTSISSQNITTTFSTNLPVSKRVVGNQQTPFQKVSFSTVTGTSTPNPPGVIIPFALSSIYVPVKGTHFCWEWRHKNASARTAMLLDALQSTTHRGLVLPSTGVGCSGATASVSFVNTRPTSSFRASLTSVPPNARALMMIGLEQKQIVLPGWCSYLETVPLLHLYGTIDSAGRWDYVAPMTAFQNVSTFKMLLQYAFADTRQPFGVGVSNMAVYQTPLPGAYNISRAYKGTAAGTVTGDETATTAAGTTVSYGVITGFTQ